MKKFLSYVCLFCIAVTILLQPEYAKADAKSQAKEDVCIISVALDVSGSMKKTDFNRDVVGIMKMMMDICDENDYFSLIAYNDNIVYQSGLISTGDTKALKKAKKEFDELVYEGDTDNGLGLITATKTITDSGIDFDKATIIQISDGDTDLKNSPLNRVQADSDADIEKSTKLAKDNNITLNVIEYTSTYTADTTLFSVAASETGGTVTIVNEPMQFAQVALNMFFRCFNDGKVTLELKEDAKTTNKETVKFETKEYAEEYYFIYAQDAISEFEILDEDVPCQVIKEDRYVVIKADDASIEKMKLLYVLENSCNVLTGLVKVDFAPEQEVITTVEVVEVERQSQKPVGKDVKLESYSTKDRFRYDVSQMFEDDDIIGYAFLNEEDSKKAELLGNVLLVNIAKEGLQEVTVVATDAVGNTATATLSIDVTASWRKYTVLIVLLIVAFILFVTLILCILIIRFVLFRKKKVEQPAISGYLMAQFVDIKTKNSFSDVEWDLSQYPPEGVSLQELFLSKGIREELKDTDKVCFYPAKMPHEILLVHCIEGGVFIGDRHVKANTPTVVRYGNKIYVSLAENASEIELTYSGN